MTSLKNYLFLYAYKKISSKSEQHLSCSDMSYCTFCLHTSLPIQILLTGLHDGAFGSDVQCSCRRHSETHKWYLDKKDT